MCPDIPRTNFELSNLKYPENCSPFNWGQLDHEGVMSSGLKAHMYINRLEKKEHKNSQTHQLLIQNYLDKNDNSIKPKEN